MALNLPPFLDDVSATTILARMKASLVQAYGRPIDVGERSLPHDALSPASLEIAQAALFAQQVLQRVFPNATDAILGDYLALAMADVGMEYIGATKAGVTLTISGTNGTIIPVGSQYSTPGTTQKPPQVFVTDDDATISGGSVSVAATALIAGAAGNVGANTVTLMVTRITGVLSVTNVAAASGGTDKESDANALVRYQKFLSAPTGGGRPADYINWSLAVNGVGGASIVTGRDGPGTVPIALVGTDKLPASQAVVDAVLDTILYPWRLSYEAEAQVITVANGVSIDTTLVDDVVDSILMQYSVTAAGQIKQLSLVPNEAGIWTLRLRMKVDSAVGANNLVQFGIWDLSAANWANTAPTGGTPANVTLKPNQMSTLFAWYSVDFYWNGVNNIELRATRLQTDTTTKLWIDQIYYRSAFQANDGSGKGLSPAGARVSTEPAVSVPVNIVATITIMSGYDRTTVLASITTRLTDYIKNIVFAQDNDIHFVRIAGVILDTPGVSLYSGLTINGGTADIVVGPQQAAIIGTVTLS